MSRPSFASGDDRSDRPARQSVDQYRRGPLIAGNASFPALAQVASLPAALELAGRYHLRLLGLPPRA